jgi:hypothetical protein
VELKLNSFTSSGLHSALRHVILILSVVTVECYMVQHFECRMLIFTFDWKLVLTNVDTTRGNNPPRNDHYIISNQTSLNGHSFQHLVLIANQLCYEKPIIITNQPADPYKLSTLILHRLNYIKTGGSKHNIDRRFPTIDLHC